MALGFRFRIPDDVSVVKKLIESVPSHWLWLNGYLKAPKKLVEAGKVEVRTGFQLSRSHIIRPTIIGERDQDRLLEKEKPNLYSIMIERKRPGFVVFEEVGYEGKHGRNITLVEAQRVAAGFVWEGYFGWLEFCLSDYDNCPCHNPAKCSFSIPEILGKDSSVELDWSPEYGGGREDLKPIMAVCLELGLRKIQTQL